MASEVMIRTAAGMVSADKFDINNSPYLPVEHTRVAPFIREPVELSPVSGSVILKNSVTTVRWECHKTADYIGNVCVRATVSDIAPNPAYVSPNTGVASAMVRYSDYLGLHMFQQIRVKYGTQLLQTIYPEEIWVAINSIEDDEEQAAYKWLVRGDLTTIQRQNLRTAPQEIKIPLLTAFFHREECQHLFMNGLTSKLAIEVDFLPPSYWVQSDGQLAGQGANSIGNTTTPATPLTPDQFLLDCTLNAEYIHVLEGERKQMTMLYKNPAGLRQIFYDQQYYSNEKLPGTTNLTSNYQWTTYVKNLTRPVCAIHTLFRWAQDVSALCGFGSGTGAGIYGQGGRDLFNMIGPVSVGTRCLVKSYDIKSGNNYIMKPQTIQEYRYWHHQKGFKGYPNLPYPHISFAHDSTARNAALGSIEFNMVDQPQSETILSSDGGFATINAAAVSSIGVASDLQQDIIAFTYNNIDISAHDLHKPFD